MVTFLFRSIKMECILCRSPLYFHFACAGGQLTHWVCLTTVLASSFAVNLNRYFHTAMAFQTLLGRCAATALQILVFSVIAAWLGADFAIDDRSIKYCQSTRIASQTNRSTEIVLFSSLLGSAVVLLELTQSFAPFVAVLSSHSFPIFCWMERAHVSIFTERHGTETSPFLCLLLYILHVITMKLKVIA